MVAVILLIVAAINAGEAHAETTPELVSVDFSDSVVTFGDAVTLRITITETETITQASIRGAEAGSPRRGQFNYGVATEWERTGNVFSVTIPITRSLTPDVFRLTLLDFVGTDGKIYQVSGLKEGMDERSLPGGEFDCVSGWHASSGSSIQNCVSYFFVGNGFEIVESDTPFIELESMTVTPGSIIPGGEATFEADVAGVRVESMEITLELDDDTRSASVHLERSVNNDNLLSGFLATAPPKEIGDWNVTFMKFQTTLGVVYFYADCDAESAGNRPGWQAVGMAFANPDTFLAQYCGSDAFVETPVLTVTEESEPGIADPVFEDGAGDALPDPASRTTDSSTAPASPEDVAAAPSADKQSTALLVAVIGGILAMVAGIAVWRLRRRRHRTHKVDDTTDP